MNRLLLAFSIFAGLAAPAVAADPKDAARKGAAYLQKEFANAAACDELLFKTGEAALIGLAMLEEGVKPDDPALANITAFVRKTAIAQHETYHITTTILFLDKLAEKTETKVDRPVIQLLGVRLYAGMNAAGGWGYPSWEPVSDAEVARWKSAFEADTKAGDKLHPEVAKLHAVVVKTLQARGRSNDPGDNSNTTFGMVGLWVASRHGVPVNDAFPLVERRFLTSWQNEGGWRYDPKKTLSLAMTCVGLLGLAIGEASRVADTKPAVPKPQPMKDDPFFNPKKPADVRKPLANAAKDDMINKAILGLGQAMTMTAVNKFKDGNFQDYIQQLAPHGHIYYTLWSLERCAVAYGLETFADVDWYLWGSEILLKMQSDNGSWGGSPYPDTTNTAFAVLFLMKANSYRDLTHRMAGKVKDPGTKELRATPNAKPLFTPTDKPAPPVEPKKMPTTTPGGFSPPAPAPTNEAGEVEKAVQQLLAAKDAEWATRLAAVRDGKGANFTQILVQLATLAEGERRKLAREYLAERLTRMTAKTLQAMIQDIEPELRRAACLACGMKELNESIPWLIDRITDPNDAVSKAAHAALKSLAGVDHGPAAGAADDDGRLKAAAAWRAWYEKRGK